MNKHLVIIRGGGLGDIAILVPIIKGLINEYPELKITLIVSTFYHPIFSSLPVELVDINVYTLRGEKKHILKHIRENIKEPIDICVDLLNIRRTKYILKILGEVGVETIVIPEYRSDMRTILTLENKQIKQLKSMHQRIADTFEIVGYPIKLNEENLLDRRYVKKNKKSIGIAPFSKFKNKIYPLHLMEVVIEYLNKSDSNNIMIFGHESENEQVKSWEVKFKNVYNLIGKKTLEEELEIISNLDVMVAMDSGNGHLATNYGIPVVTIWGLTHPYCGYTPYLQPIENSITPDIKKFPLLPTSEFGADKPPKGYEKIMETIKPEEIINRIKDIMGEMDLIKSH